jgi:steroid 5-alpha reductase family enzyme
MTVITGDKYLFGLCALITFGYQTFFYVIAATFKFDKVTDLAGGTNFLILAIVTWALAEGSVTKTAANVLVIAWGLRLSSYLFYRILVIGEDGRFDEMRGDPLKFLGFWIFQFLWVYIVSLPFIFLNGSSVSHSEPELSSAAISGIILSSIGLIIETSADQIKFSFRQNPQNKGKWCTDGVWKYSRHPNYFGEITFWWGLFILSTTSMGSGNEWGYFTILSPVFTTTLLLFVSGLPILEASSHKKFRSDPNYKAYLLRTSILVPMPPSLYKCIPQMIKQVLLFDWTIYRAGLDQEVYSEETRLDASIINN